ncbi:hypothetical protein BZG36_03279 [Bifiguratus adelaidae]|uniref:Uncharacterized protein n=1 Tax=Bifiguratus adelaidae TaxID=1938954 RepID=A0A261XZX1_9FUNG|nr:hypothetical protein BZG36_03279 [Bifiguratus adelaidae]
MHLSTGDWLNDSRGLLNHLARSLRDHPWEAAGLSAIAYAIYLISDRWLWSPLRDIPGPKAAIFSRFYIANIRASGKEYLWIQDLHETYGNIVRIGDPKTVILSDPSALKEIYGTQQFIKSDFHAPFSFKNVPNIFSTRDPSEHNRRRRLMSHGFSMSNIASMERFILDSGVIKLMDKFDKRFAGKGIEVNMYNEWHCMAFDVIGELAYGQSFGMIDRGHHPFTKWLAGARGIPIVQGTFPILARAPGCLMFCITPVSYLNQRRMFRFAQDLYAARRRMGKEVDRPDLMSLLINGVDPETGEQLTYDEQITESLAFVIAGTDTTSNTLTNLIFLLCEHPQVLQRLQQELDKVMPDRNAAMSYKRLDKEHAPFLWAVLMESMRLRTVVPTGLPRLVPKGGCALAGHYLPEGTEVSINPHMVHHDPEIFSNPDKFLPDRWLTEDSAKLARYHIPFSLGPRMCIGKNIAWMELTLALAHLVWRFKFSLADPEKQTKISHFFLTRPGI